MISNKISIVLLVFVFVLNFGHSYKSIENYLYHETSSNVIDEIFNLFKQNEPKQPAGTELKKIGDILSSQLGIEDSYVMTGQVIFTHYANSKTLATSLEEGSDNDTIENYITRKNWSDYDLFFSNIMSHPSNMMNTYNPRPDYLIYTPNEDHHDYLKVLENPKNPTIPSNFEVIYRSNKTGTIVYKISHND